MHDEMMTPPTDQQILDALRACGREMMTRQLSEEDVKRYSQEAARTRIARELRELVDGQSYMSDDKRHGMLVGAMALLGALSPYLGGDVWHAARDAAKDVWGDE